MSSWLVRQNASIYLASSRIDPRSPARPFTQPWRSLSSTRSRQQDGDPRIRELGREISDDYATLRDSYGRLHSSSPPFSLNISGTDPISLATPRYPIVLAHGLLGFSELQLASYLPAVQYWYGIREALVAQGASVICASVPPSSSIEDRAAKLREDIDAAASSPAYKGARPERVNIIAHSMGGLDARCMIRHLAPRTADVASLVTVSSPHRGSQLADVLLDAQGDAPIHLPRLYGLMERAGLGTAAFAQLTRAYMTGTFNPATPDREAVRYFSFGAACDEPPLLSPFRQPWRLICEAEGPNDGLVSVASGRWGEYRGTLVGVSHLDLINWSNRVRWTVREWMGMKRTFNAIAFYLDIADMLAREDL